MPLALLALGLLAAQAAASPEPAAPDSLAPEAPAASYAAADTIGAEGEPRGRLVEPAGVATDAFGRVYATDAATHRLVRWDAAGRVLDEAGSLGSEPNEFRRPGAIARLGSLGVAVLDVENRRVVTYDVHLRLVGVLADLAGPDLEPTLGPVSPVGLASDRGGAVYVADADGDRVLAFDFSGRFLRAIGSHGEAEGRFRGLAAIATDAQGVLVAADRPRERGPARLQWFDAGGRVTRVVFAPAAAAAPRRTGALAVAVDDSGRVALADEETGEVVLLDGHGRVRARAGGLERPCALAFAPDGTLLVAERGAARLRRLQRVAAAPGH